MSGKPARRWGLVALVAAGLVLLLALARAGGLLDVGRSALGEATRLRALAAVDCRQRLFPQCVHKLDVARDLDPKGDDDPQVRAWREAAVAAMATGEAGP